MFWLRNKHFYVDLHKHIHIPKHTNAYALNQLVSPITSVVDVNEQIQMVKN